MDLRHALDEVVRGLGGFLDIRSLAGLVGAREMAIVDAFRAAGAISPRRAQRIHALSSLDAVAFQQLLHAGVIRSASAGRTGDGYWLGGLRSNHRRVSRDAPPRRQRDSPPE